MLRITARAAVRPTEDAERVKKALLALFPHAQVEEREGEIVARPHDLARLRQLIASSRIPDTARAAMLAGLSHDARRARFMVGKQAAAAGRASFGALGAPLGEIEVELEGDDEHEVERAIYHVAPDTTVPPELAEVPLSERPPTE